MQTWKIAVVPGDGIGKEIVPEGIRVMDEAARLLHFRLQYDYYPWGAEHYLEHGEFMPADGLQRLREYDAIYFGAIGHPDVDDTLPAIRYTFRVRKGLQQYVNFRPVRLIPGVPSPLRSANAGDVDFVVVRENSEGEFSEVGQIVNPDSETGLALQTSIFTRHGIERIAHYAFALARTRRSLVTNVTKSNTLIHSLLYWDKCIAAVAGAYPDVKYEKMYVDNASAQFVLAPERFDVILTTNMIGDILSDLGGAIMGGLGLAPSGNINPERDFPSMFEPIHGSAPDIAGRGVANPVSAIWSGALMLRHLGKEKAASRIEGSLFAALARGVLTPDLGGDAYTVQMTDAVLEHLIKG